MKKILRDEKRFYWAIAVLSLLLLIPLLVIAGYNTMSADDYAVGKGLHLISTTPSLTDAFRYALQHVESFHTNWRGCFTINFLDCFNPAFFGERNAWLTPVLALLVMLSCSYFFVAQGMKLFWDAAKKDIFLVWAILQMILIQTMPSPAETIYWYCGVTSYTFAQGFFFLFFGVLFALDKETEGRKIIGKSVVLIILGFLTGGCQYTICLETLIWYAFYLFFFGKKIRIGKILAALSLVAGSAVNILAPGNQVRKNKSGGGMGAVSAIMESFAWAMRSVKEWVGPMLLIVMLLLVPVIWHILSKSRKKRPYRYPVAFVLLSFCVLASCYTASLYGLGDASAGRIQNQVQSFFYILLFMDLFYILGYIQYKGNEKQDGLCADICKAAEIFSRYRLYYMWMMLVCIGLVLIGTGDKNKFASVSATRSLVLGEADIYYSEYEERLSIYHDNSIACPVLEPYSVRPKVLYVSDLVSSEEDIDYWVNKSVAVYYGKEKVLLRNIMK